MYFSIVVPVYNAENYISRAIESIIMQTFQDFELILVNDGSKDGSSVILEKYQKQSEKITVFHIENSGVSHARNVGIEYASGKYLLFLDADDIFLSDSLQKIHDICEKKSPDLLTYGYREINIYHGNKKEYVRNGKWSQYFSKNKIKENYLTIIQDEMFGAVWSKVYKNQLIKEHSIRMNEELYLGEDYCFNINVLNAAENYFVIEDQMYGYFIENNKSIINRYKTDKFEQMYKLHQIRKENILKNSLNSQKEKQCNIYMNFIRLCFSCFMDFSRLECHLTHREKIRSIKQAINVEMEKKDKSYKKYLSFYQRIVYNIFETKNAFIILMFSRVCYILKFKVHVSK